MSQALWETGQLPGLSGPKQAGTALKMVRQHWMAMLVILVVMSGYLWGASQVTRSLNLMAAPGITGPYLGFTLGSALIGAILSAVTLRTLLGRPPLAFDGGVLAYIGIAVLVAIAPALLQKLVVGVPPTDTADSAAMMAYGMKGMVVGLVTLACALVALKFMLWPIGLVVGDREVTPGVSWRLTQRAFWGYIIAVFLLGIVPYVVMTVLIVTSTRASGMTPASAVIPPLAAPFLALFGLAFTTVAAALFWLRRSGADESVAVFD